jgi:hypothetical protein
MRTEIYTQWNQFYDLKIASNIFVMWIRIWISIMRIDTLTLSFWLTTCLLYLCNLVFFFRDVFMIFSTSIDLISLSIFWYSYFSNFELPDIFKINFIRYQNDSIFLILFDCLIRSVFHIDSFEMRYWFFILITHLFACLLFK